MHLQGTFTATKSREKTPTLREVTTSSCPMVAVFWSSITWTPPVTIPPSPSRERRSILQEGIGDTASPVRDRAKVLPHNHMVSHLSKLDTKTGQLLTEITPLVPTPSKNYSTQPKDQLQFMEQYTTATVTYQALGRARY
ncbi:uncharacterized protein LOC125042042 [Penaeus chinensis]|uniref:uncharacterized protein LOC125042042 n=1 Tax=Penaeus chinensis TaxID=139456 RepID=UPI001FB75BDA|nr:uncharacterized protein LOC125042042 [Penaeus chinensis]